MALIWKTLPTQKGFANLGCALHASSAWCKCIDNEITSGTPIVIADAKEFIALPIHADLYNSEFDTRMSSYFTYVKYHLAPPLNDYGTRRVELLLRTSSYLSDAEGAAEWVTVDGVRYSEVFLGMMNPEDGMGMIYLMLTDYLTNAMKERPDLAKANCAWVSTHTLAAQQGLAQFLKLNKEAGAMWNVLTKLINGRCIVCQQIADGRSVAPATWAESGGASF